MYGKELNIFIKRYELSKTIASNGKWHDPQDLRGLVWVVAIMAH
jgi:hypothetical protein